MKEEKNLISGMIYESFPDVIINQDLIEYFSKLHIEYKILSTQLISTFTKFIKDNPIQLNEDEYLNSNSDDAKKYKKEVNKNLKQMHQFLEKKIQDLNVDETFQIKSIINRSFMETFQI